MKKIFVTLSTFAKFGLEPLELLEKSGFQFEVNKLGRRLRKDEIAKFAGDCNSVIAGIEPYDQDVLSSMSNLECISRCGVGIDSIDLQYAKEKNIAILNTPDVVIQPVAELTVGMVFDLLRNISLQTSLMKSQKWERKSGFCYPEKLWVFWD